MPGLVSVGGLQKHTKLTEKEVDGVIDHAAASIPVDKLSFGMAWVKVTEIDITENTTTITITGLDLDAAKAYLILFKRRNPTGTSSSIWLYFNNDTEATNYAHQWLNGEGTGFEAGRTNSASFGYTWAGESGICIGYIMRTPEGFPRILYFENMRQSLTTLKVGIKSNLYMVNANVTRIDIVAFVAGAIGAGSKVMLFKVA